MQGPRIISFFMGLALVISVVRAETPGSKSNPSLLINIPAREVSLYDSGQLIYRLPIAVGSPIHETPVGPREMTMIVWNPWWFPPPSPWAKGAKPTPPGPQNPLGVVKMDLGEAIFLHGTNNESSIGHPASHGCMRMKNADARQLAWWLQTHLTDKTAPALLDEYGKKRWQSYYVKLDQAVPVTIEYDVVKLGGEKLEIHPDFYGRMGEKEPVVRHLLISNGLNPDRLDRFAYEKLLKKSQDQSVKLPLKELFPGTVEALDKPIPDPVDEAWRTKQNLPEPVFYSDLPPNFTFLF